MTGLGGEALMNAVSSPYTRGPRAPSVLKHVMMGKGWIVTRKRDSSSEHDHGALWFPSQLLEH